MPKQPKKLDELFHDGLRDIYFAEKKILVGPKLPSNASKSSAESGFRRPLSYALL